MTDRRPTTDRPVTIAEAARIMGVSPEAVRSRIRRKTIRAEPQGKRWLVWPDLPTGHQPTADRPADRPEPTSAPDRSDRDHDEVLYLRERLKAAEEANAELRRLLLAAMTKPDVPALHTAPPARQDEAGSTSRQQSDQHRRRPRTWRQRLLAWLQT